MEIKAISGLYSQAKEPRPKFLCNVLYKQTINDKLCPREADHQIQTSSEMRITYKKVEHK